jgi:hypothetical protein
MLQKVRRVAQKEHKQTRRSGAQPAVAQAPGPGLQAAPPAVHPHAEVEQPDAPQVADQAGGPQILQVLQAADQPEAPGVGQVGGGVPEPAVQPAQSFASAEMRRVLGPMEGWLVAEGDEDVAKVRLLSLMNMQNI